MIMLSPASRDRGELHQVLRRDAEHAALLEASFHQKGRRFMKRRTAVRCEDGRVRVQEVLK
jgi:hypothetical protein